MSDPNDYMTQDEVDQRAEASNTIKPVFVQTVGCSNGGRIEWQTGSCSEQAETNSQEAICVDNSDINKADNFEIPIVHPDDSENKNGSNLKIKTECDDDLDTSSNYDSESDDSESDDNESDDYTTQYSPQKPIMGGCTGSNYPAHAQDRPKPSTYACTGATGASGLGSYGASSSMSKLLSNENMNIKFSVNIEAPFEFVVLTTGSLLSLILGLPLVWHALQ